MKKTTTRDLVGLAMLTAIVVVLQLLGSFIHFGPFSISLVLIPIVIGAALYGAGAGAWLGLAFSVTVLLSGDASWFLGYSVFGTVVTVLAKGTLAGFFAGLTYRAFVNKNRYLAMIAAAIVAPVVNTGVFALGCLAFFLPLIARDLAEEGQSAVVVLFTGVIGLNFFVELASDIILSPVALRLIDILKNRRK